MKKIISLVLSGIMLTCCVLAVDISYNKPNDEINDKIIEALIENKTVLFNEIYYSNSTEYIVKEVTYIDYIANINENYLIMYTCDNISIKGWKWVRIGDYAIRFYGVGYAVYSSEKNELMSIEEAYNKGILTNEILGEFSEFYLTSQNEYFKMFYPIGDLNKDAKIDIVDVVIMRKNIVNNNVLYDFEELSSDLNNDGVSDISDVVIMRSIIVNK